jgi:hypothetical protein
MATATATSEPAAVVAGRAHLLGVRHHGPGSARSTRRALDALRPAAVLVELPADVEPVLRWIADDALVPPVALLGYVTDRPERAVFCPLAEFSPEWQAARWAVEHGAALHPIDLPLAHVLAGEPADELTLDLAGRPLDPLAELAAAAGDPDPERWWDDVVEHRGDGEPAFAAIASAMAAVRAGTTTPLGEQRREAHMRRAIRSALAAHPDQPIAVVCGAWHVPALDPGAVSAGVDATTLRGLPKVKVAVTWVPWTHRRLTRSSGYGAGVASPGWYAHVFAHPGPAGVTRFFVDAARVLRGQHHVTSPDHLIAASRLATSLAALRGRPRPGLPEVVDAAGAVLTDSGGLRVVADELVVGEAVGVVPDGTPQVPLARDLAVQQRRCRLTPAATSKVVELDLRTPTGLARSQLLHRLSALGVPWGVLEQGRGSSGTFRETWRLSWEPELAIRLVELAAHGTTVASAATQRLVERAGVATALADLVSALEQALLADLPAAVEPCVRRLADCAAHDPDVATLMDALVPLARALQYGDVRGTDAASLRLVFDGIVVRVVAGLAAACASLDDDAASAMVERLAGVQAALALVDHPARRDPFPGVLAVLAERGHAGVQGRATRLLHDAGHWSPAATGARFSRALSSGTAPAEGAAFVEGFLAGSGTVLLHDRELLDVVDAWLSTLRADAFHVAVPLLRRTFGAFESAERRQLGMIVAGRAAPRHAGYGDDLDPARADAALSIVRHLLGATDDR